MNIVGIRTKENQQIPLGKFTVLVGPNNVGKSQTLKDIHAKMTSGRNARTTILTEIEVQKPDTFDELLAGLKVIDDPDHLDHHLVSGIGSNLRSGDQIRVHMGNLEQQFNASDNLDFTFGNISKYRVSYLDAASRLQVAQTAGANNPHTEVPQNLLQGLFVAEQAVERTLRRAFFETFGMDVRLDYSGMTQLSIRVAQRFGEIDADPRNAYRELSKHGRLDDQGDGFRSFVGVVLSLLLSHGRIVLLDEPEAFLHPAQARQLGIWVAEHAGSGPGQVVVATHNASFLSGIISSGQPVDIFRINRRDDFTKYTRISPEATSRLATSPVLSSQRVLESIFHRGVAVCEADADRAIYEAVASRELRSQDAFYLHAHNKQTVPQVVTLLKDAQIPVCAIVDIDILNSADDLSRCLTALQVTAEQKAELLGLRAQLAERIGEQDETTILASLEHSVTEFLRQLEDQEHTLSGARGALNRLRKQATEWYEVKKDGLSALEPVSRPIAEELLKMAAEVGLFIVPVGELESWIDVGTSQKNKWVVRALEQLHDGECPDGLRTFISNVTHWVGGVAIE